MEYKRVVLSHRFALPSACVSLFVSDRSNFRIIHESRQPNLDAMRSTPSRTSFTLRYKKYVQLSVN
eukprot:scaffold4809_cov116-Cylindrotheca_fusiformis.AAC.2